MIGPRPGPETFAHEGKARRVLGRLHFARPPVPGSLVGPSGMGDLCVVLGTVVEADRPVTLIGLATQEDTSRAEGRMVHTGPASIRERQAMTG